MVYAGFYFGDVLQLHAGRDAASSPEKSLGVGVRGGGRIPTPFFFFAQNGVGVSSYITNPSDKQASKQKQQQKEQTRFFRMGGGGVWTTLRTRLVLSKKSSE